MKVLEDIKAKMEAWGTKSALHEIQGLNIAELRHNCPYRRKQMEKHRMWIVGISLLISVSQLSDFHRSFIGIIQPLFFGLVGILGTYAYFVWISQKIDFYGEMGAKIDIKLKYPEFLSLFETQHASLQQRLSAQAEQKGIDDLRSELRTWHYIAGERQGKGDYKGAGDARGKVAEIESMLRERGL